MAMTRIPDKLKVVLKPWRKISREVMGRKEVAQVRDAFVVPADSPEMLETAIGWARGYSKQGWVTAQEQGYRLHGKEPEIVEIDNMTFTQLQLWKIEHRGNGGVAYKVITKEDWYVDLREAEFLDASIEFGMGKGGKLKGVFRWVRSGSSQMRIAFVDSKLYQECEVADRKAHLKPISLGKLVVGGVYKGTHPHEHVYLGKIRYEGKTLRAWQTLNSYHLQGKRLDDYQGRFDMEQRCSPHIQVVKTKKVLELLEEINVTEVRVSYIQGWSHGHIERDEIEWCDLSLAKE